MLCAFLDLESTGLFLKHAEVIEVGAVCRLLRPDGAWTPGGSFRQLVAPRRGPGRKVRSLTGLSNKLLRKQGRGFQEVLAAWREWLRREAQGLAADEICLVGHNILAYDLPLLLAQHRREERVLQLRSCGHGRLPHLFEDVPGLFRVLDTLRLSRQLAKEGTLAVTKHSLSALHMALLQRPLPHGHTALGDAEGLAALCREGPLAEGLRSALADGKSAALLPVADALQLARRLARRQELWRPKQSPKKVAAPQRKAPAKSKRRWRSGALRRPARLVAAQRRWRSGVLWPASLPKTKGLLVF